MPIRTALPASVTIAEAGGANPITIDAHDLGDSTDIAPNDQSQSVLAGYSRPTGAPFDVVVMGYSDDFDALDALQVAGALLDVTLNFDDGGTKKAKNVGFTVVPTAPPRVGSLDGWTLTGFTQAATVGQALTTT